MSECNAYRRSFLRFRPLLLLFGITLAAGSLLALLKHLNQAVDAPAELGVGNEATTSDSMVVACVGPLSGSRAYLGSDSCRGAALLIEEINSQGGVAGHKLALRRYDDQADPDIAVEMAETIGSSSDIIAVIGHNTSAATIPAAAVYQKHQIAAISPSATNPRVTAGNPYMFRVVFTDNTQAELLAHYVRSVLQHSSVGIAYVDDAYGRLLDERFVATAKRIGLSPLARVSVPVEPSQADIKGVADALLSGGEPDSILLALFKRPGTLLINELRRRGLSVDLVGTDALATIVERQHQSASDDDQRHSSRPTDGMYISTPFSAEAASSQAREFLRRYFAAYNSDAGWHAVHAYDSAHVIAEALRALKLPTERPTIPDLRKSLRDQIARFNAPSSAVSGLLGQIFFDDNGDVLRPLFIAQAAGASLAAAPQQLQLIDDPAQVAALREEGENVVELNDQTLLQVTQVVRTGLRLARITNIDDKARTFHAEFELWFRAGGRLDTAGIVFPDALEPIVLKKPVSTLTFSDQRYEAFAVSGIFSYRPSREHIITGERDLVIRYRHNTRDLSRLVLVPDRGRMGLENRQAWSEKLRERRDDIVALEGDWVLAGGTIAQDSAHLSTLGNPLLSSAELPFSVLSAAVHVQKAEFSLRRYLEKLAGDRGSWFGVLGFLVLLLATFSPWIRGYHPIIATFVRFALVTVLILLAERLFVETMAQDLEIYQLETTLLIFKSLWWIIPAILVIAVLRPLVWVPIEQRTGRPVPKIAMLFANLAILVTAGIAIMAFVFDQSLTSIGVASGVLTVVVGFALQSLILDTFAGLLLNIERPFRIGDKIMLNDDPRLRGFVDEMNWRTTKIKTEIYEEVVVIPNSEVSRAKILNYARTGPQWLNIVVMLDHGVAPEYGEKILTDAANNCRGQGKVLDQPALAMALDWDVMGVNYFVGIKTNLNDNPPALALSPLIKSVEKRLAEEGIKPTVPIQRIDVQNLAEEVTMHIPRPSEVRG